MHNKISKNRPKHMTEYYLRPQAAFLFHVLYKCFNSEKKEGGREMKMGIKKIRSQEGGKNKTKPERRSKNTDWVAQSVKHLTPDFGSGHDLRVMRWAEP